MKKVLLLAALAAFAVSCSDDEPIPTDFPLGLSLDSVRSLRQIDHRLLPKLDVQALRAEDARQALIPGAPHRVAEPVALGVAMQSAGTREALSDGGTLWRLRVSSHGAIFVSFALANFELPEGARLFFYSVEQDYVAGPYTSSYNNAERVFGSPAIPAGTDGAAVIELYVPAGVGIPNIVIESVSHGYRDFRNLSQVRYWDTSQAPAQTDPVAKLACEVDINCPEGSAWQNEKRAVAETYDGRFVCTGTLLNNVRADCTDYFLTANHCVSSSRTASQLTFYWNYENSTCTANDAPVNHTSSGSTLRATNRSSDFTLLELSSPPDSAYAVYHAGWNNSPSAPSSAACIHHPNDEPKKISFEYDPLRDGGDFSGGWGATHWRVTGWDVGTTEPGSSGSAIFNSAHQVVGQLHGGTGDCSGGWDEFGKFAVSWGGGLSTWLDADNTSATSVSGLDCGGGPPPPPPQCDLGQTGDTCSSNADCCSDRCRGRRGRKTCR